MKSFHVGMSQYLLLLLHAFGDEHGRRPIKTADNFKCPVEGGVMSFEKYW